MLKRTVPEDSSKMNCDKNLSGRSHKGAMTSLKKKKEPLFCYYGRQFCDLVRNHLMSANGQGKVSEVYLHPADLSSCSSHAHIIQKDNKDG